MAEKSKEKKVKFYNPYPFPMRMINDLKKEQVLAPQGHGKVFRNEYDQSKLELVLCDKSKEKTYKPGLDVDLDELLKKDLVDLAWAVKLKSDRQQLEAQTKKQLIKAIREKVGDEELEEEEEPEEEVEKKRPAVDTDVTAENPVDEEFESQNPAEEEDEPIDEAVNHLEDKDSD